MLENNVDNNKNQMWITSYTGRKIVLANPDLDAISIKDIAHALSMYCRYVGHVHSFYSVGEHCIRCSALAITPENKLENLLHDASEAYLGDVSRPLKQLLPDYKKIEKKWDLAIRCKFGLNEIESQQCNNIDGIMCVTEMKHLFNCKHPENPLAKVGPECAIEDYQFNWASMECVEDMFLREFYKLYKEVHGEDYVE